MAFRQRRPYSAVTIHIDRLTGPTHDENDLGVLVDLIEVIRIQDSGPTEAARALRKKLKYGDAEHQIRALTIIDELMQNGGVRFQRTFVDEPLLERLRILPMDPMVDAKVQQKANMLFRQWAGKYQDTPGLRAVAALHKQSPTRQKPAASQSKVVRETEAQAEDENPFEDDTERVQDGNERRESIQRPSLAVSSPSSSVKAATPAKLDLKKDKKQKSKTKTRPFNLEQDKSKMLEVMAAANVASTDLLNSLKFVNRETQQVSDDPSVVSRFEACKLRRRQVLFFIQHVESDQWIGSLLNANDNLVNALMTYEIMDKSIDDDSDSDVEVGHTSAASPLVSPGRSSVAALSPVEHESQFASAFTGLSIAQSPPAKPPRPPVNDIKHHELPRQKSNEGRKINQEVDENDPFGDQNAIS